MPLLHPREPRRTQTSDAGMVGCSPSRHSRRRHRRRRRRLPLPRQGRPGTAPLIVRHAHVRATAYDAGRTGEEEMVCARHGGVGQETTFNRCGLERSRPTLDKSKRANPANLKSVPTTAVLLQRSDTPRPTARRKEPRAHEALDIGARPPRTQPTNLRQMSTARSFAIQLASSFGHLIQNVQSGTVLRRPGRQRPVSRRAPLLPSHRIFRALIPSASPL